MGTRIPACLLRDLKCRHCSNFLSCGPVYVSPDSGLLCGRCKAIAKPNFRNYVYEELANTFKFPCQNWGKHCPEEGSWNGLREHEINCQYGGSCGLMCVDPVAFFSSKRMLPNEECLLYLEVPENCLNLVCCKNCSKYLSCEPVHINVVGSNICHRCYLSNGQPPNTLRNLAYEKIANIFRFPCIFKAKGCPMKFKFGRDSWEHEVNCHYKDVQISSALPSPTVKVQRVSDVDSSGYRLSYEGHSPTVFRKTSFHHERTLFELPRVSSILNDKAVAEEIRRGQQKKNSDEQLHGLIGSRTVQPPNSKYESTGYDGTEWKDRIQDKERGIVSTHSGHVYATLTKTSVLFAPPQMQRNTGPSNGSQVTREFQNMVRRNASNASQGEYSHREKMGNPFVSESTFSTAEKEAMNDSNSEVANSVDSGSYQSPDKRQISNLGKSGEEFSPVVREYVQYNPQNNVQRNESITIGNADLIAELKMRNEQRRKNKQQNNHPKDIEVH